MEQNDPKCVAKAEKKRKPLMILDPSMAITHEVPLHPDTGKPWAERHAALVDLATAYRFSGHDEHEQRRQIKQHYDSLREGVTFGQEPLIMQHTVILGALAAKEARGTPQPSFVCHPETWAGFKDETRALFELILP